jgi:uncharacterized protein with ATP-grasp and redox domains
MIFDYRCFFCLVKSFEKVLEKEDIPLTAKNQFTHELTGFYTNNWGKLNSPEFARELHALLRVYTHNDDPYRDRKKTSNDEVLELVPWLNRLISESDDRFITALRLSIAGNIIDFAANDSFDVKEEIRAALKNDFAIDHSERLHEAVALAKSILYIGDNAGEIVFDRLFIETLKSRKVTYVVRGGPVINDATMDDALYTGMHSVARVISGGYDAPSAIPEKSGPEFRQLFETSDLIISKGQGNLEGLYSYNDKRIFFLLLVKCNVIAELLGVKKKGLIVMNGQHGKQINDKRAE